jgi:hypothetical protein
MSPPTRLWQKLVRLDDSKKREQFCTIVCYIRIAGQQPEVQFHRFPYYLPLEMVEQGSQKKDYPAEKASNPDENQGDQEQGRDQA